MSYIKDELLDKQNQFEDTEYALEELADEFASEYGIENLVKFRIEQDGRGFFQIVDGEEGPEKVYIEEKYYPVVNKFI